MGFAPTSHDRRADAGRGSSEGGQSRYSRLLVSCPKRISPKIEGMIERRIAAAGIADIAAKIATAGSGSASRSRTASGSSNVRICWPSATSPTASASAGTASCTYYNFNIRLEATNVCVASCLFCSFARLTPDSPFAYTLSIEQVLDKLRQRAHQPLTEVHVVNGLHPDLPFDYYPDMLRGLKTIRPGIHLKCFTAVEIAFFADIYKMTRSRSARAARSTPGSTHCPAAVRRSLPRVCARRSRTTRRMRIATSPSTASLTSSGCGRT